MEQEEIKKYEMKLIELGYDWKVGNKGWCRGIVYGGRCYSFYLMPPEDPRFIEVMHIPAKYVSSVRDPNWKVSRLEEEILKEFLLKEGKTETLIGIKVENKRPLVS